MAHTLVDPNTSFQTRNFTEKDQLYLALDSGTPPVLTAADLVTQTSGDFYVGGSRSETEVELDNGQTIKIPGASITWDSKTVNMHAPANDPKLLEIKGAFISNDYMLGNSWQKDGAGASFLTRITQFAPVEGNDMHYTFRISPFNVDLLDAPVTP